MDKQHFDQLVKGVFEMKRLMAGKVVTVAISIELNAKDQHRTCPTEPARALLKIVSMNPRAIEALHA